MVSHEEFCFCDSLNCLFEISSYRPVIYMILHACVLIHWYFLFQKPDFKPSVANASTSIFSNASSFSSFL